MLKSYTIPYHASYYTEEGGRMSPPFIRARGRGREGAPATRVLSGCPHWAGQTVPRSSEMPVSPAVTFNLTRSPTCLTRDENPLLASLPEGELNDTFDHVTRGSPIRTSRLGCANQSFTLHSVGLAGENHSVGHDRDSAPRLHKYST